MSFCSAVSGCIHVWQDGHDIEDTKQITTDMMLFLLEYPTYFLLIFRNRLTNGYVLEKEIVTYHLGGLWFNRSE